MSIAGKVVALVFVLLVCAELMIVGVCFALFAEEEVTLRQPASVSAAGVVSGLDAPVPSLRRLRSRALQLAGLILGVAVLCGYFLAETIAAPLRELLAAVTHVTNGNYRVRLTPRGSDETAKLSGAFNTMARGLEEREKMKVTLSKFHDPSLVDKLLAGKLRLGGERQRAVILFVDLRGFTTFSESVAPEALVRTLNEYLTAIVDAVHANGGIVDKFLGDGLLALWGVPDARPGDAARALRGCLAIRSAIAALNETRRAKGQAELKLGMGLNAGEVVAGNVGSRERMEYTVVGDAVNVAARIEALTKKLSTDLLVSQSVVDSAGAGFRYDACGATAVRGKRASVELYKVL